MPCHDFDFGPIIKGCRHDFDFTLYFQYTVLSALPSLLALVAALARILHLRHRQVLVGGRRLKTLKLVAISAYAGVQPVILGTGFASFGHPQWSFIVSAVLSIACALIFFPLSFIEHSRNLRPSTTLGLYAFCSVLFDTIRVRTYWLSDASLGLQASFTISTILKAAILVLESVEKKSIVPSRTGSTTPEAVSGVFNTLTFFWLNHLLWVGAKRYLLPIDLYDLDSDLSTDKAAAEFAQARKRISEKYEKARSLRALFRVLKWKVLATIPPRIVLLALTVCSPLLLGELLSYLQSGTHGPRSALGYGMILAFALLYLGIAVSTGYYWYNHFRVITLVRASLVSAINNKAGAINISLVQDPQAILTLMSSDVERISEGLRTAHELWANLIQVGVATYLLQRQVGIACVIPVLLAFISAAIAFWVSHLANLRQKEWMHVLQSRIGATSSTLLSMKGVKMRGLENKLYSVLSSFRDSELIKANHFRFLGVWTVLFGYVPELLSPALTFLVVIIRGGGNAEPLDSTTAFTSLSLIQVLAQPLNMSLQNLPFLVGTFGCLSRIDEFLALEDWVDQRLYGEDSTPPLHCLEKSSQQLEKSLHLQNPQPLGPCLNIIEVENASFGYGCQENTLENITVHIPKGKLVCLIGPVASGKSTLCKAILGELKPKLGSIQIRTETENVSISYCGQEPFIRNRTIKENIIMYSEWDPMWYRTVLEACGLTNKSSSLSQGDNTIAGSDGARLSGGQKQKIAVARALYARNQIMVCDDVLSGLDSLSAWHLFQNVFGYEGLAKKLGITVVFATHAVRFLPYTDHLIVLNAKGTVSDTGPFDALRFSSSYVKTLTTYSTEDQAILPEKEERNSSADVGVEEADTDQDVSMHLQSDFSTYYFYFRTMKSWTLVTLIILAIAVAGFYVVPSYWLKMWTQGALGTTSQYSYWGVYTCFLCSALFLLPIFEYFSFVHAATQSGIALHARILRAALNTPWSLYSRMDVGSITNRFSQDLQLVDGELPLGLQNLILSLLLALGQAILITVAAPYVGISIPAVIIVLAVVQRFYLRTSRQLRILDIEAKSPLYTHFTESLKGASTIRAFSWTANSVRECLELLDLSQKPAYLLNMVQRWLTFVLDMIVALITIIIVTIAVELQSSSQSTGVALTQVMSTSLILRTVIITWTRVEQSLGAVSRIQKFSKSTPSEHKKLECAVVPLLWPKSGRIEFKNLTAIYTSMPNKPAIREISGTIAAGQNVGICGSSGSGKSSLILTLLHMLDFQNGTVEIDGVDLRTIPRQQLRNAINTIPQEPLAIKGSIKLNLDPHSSFSDEQLFEALGKVELSTIVETIGGLEAEFQPDDYSSGQRQLFSLASAILRQSKVVLIDEASSNTDHHTDDLIQSVISKEFAGCTIITVAHRLDTIIHCQQVLVLVDGKVVEWDDPQTLLKRKSRFGELWDKQAKKSRHNSDQDMLNIIPSY